MSATLRATCPDCRSRLAIPAGLLGRAVRCKACGAVVRSKPAATPPAPPQPLPLPLPAADLDPFDLDAPPAPAVVAVPLPLPADPHPLPAAVAPGFVAGEATRAYARGRPYQRQQGGSRLVPLGLAFLVVAGLAAAGVFFGKDARGWLERVTANAPRPADEVKEPVPTADTARGTYPRRLLFVHAGNYLYLNPLTDSPAGGGQDTHRARGHADRLAFEWRVPAAKENNQLFVLSDTARGGPRPPLKGVLTETVRRFCDTSRPQDRVAIYLGGHVLGKKTDAGEAVYLVPIEGDPDEVETLIPVADLYALIGECKAAQRVVIWDVCRFNPERGRQRPGSEPMTAAVAAALTAAPDGVQVLLTCQPGENALEFFAHEPDGSGKGVVSGSSFLEAFAAVRKRGKAAKPESPDDPLPVADWADAVGRRVAAVAASADGRPKQTVTLTGTAPESLPPAAPAEPVATRFEFPSAPAGASPGAVAAAVAEFALPGIKSDDDGGGVAGFPYPAVALDPYQEDVPLAVVMEPKNKDQYGFRVRVADALGLIRTIWSKDGKPQLRESVVGEINDALKKEIMREQDYPADAITRLERAAALLEAAEGGRAEQPKRWQAHYDYAVAQVKLRIAFLQEYNLALGNIRTEVLPARDPKQGHDGYRLVAAAGMKEKSAKKLAEEAGELFDKMAAEYKGTPWGVQARRDRSQSLGLAWQPFNSKAAADKDE